MNNEKKSKLKNQKSYQNLKNKTKTKETTNNKNKSSKRPLSSSNSNKSLLNTFRKAISLEKSKNKTTKNSRKLINIILLFNYSWENIDKLPKYKITKRKSKIKKNKRFKSKSEFSN